MCVISQILAAAPQPTHFYVILAAEGRHDRWVAHIEDSPKPPPKRITLTYPVLNAAKAVYFVCTGAGKAPNLAVALGASEGSVPAGEVKPASGNLVWFVDDAASAEYREKTGL